MKTPLTDAFCNAEGFTFIGEDQLGRTIEFASRLESDRARLIEAVKHYRDSHAFCVAAEPQGVCNKCRIADALLRELGEST